MSLGASDFKPDTPRRRGLLQFSPYSFEIFDFAAFSSPGRFLLSMGVVVAILTSELNAFFLKTLLWVPPANLLNVARLTLWFFLALPAVKEWLTFISVRCGGGAGSG